MKTGRNDPCPCGSGKKYKKCCLEVDRKRVLESAGKKVEPAENDREATKDFVGPKAPKDTPKTVLPPDTHTIAERLSDARSTRFFFDRVLNTGIYDTTTLVESGIPIDSEERYDPDLDNMRGMETDEIIVRLTELGIEFDLKDLKKKAKRYRSAVVYAEKTFYSQIPGAFDRGEDFPWRAAIVLWSRLLPDIPNVETLDDTVLEGYSLLDKKDYDAAFTAWWQAWEMANAMFPSNAKDIERCNRSKWSVLLSQEFPEWCLSFETELGKAGSSNPEYHEMRIDLCTRFLKRFPEEGMPFRGQMLVARADSLLALGERGHAQAELDEVIKQFPWWMPGYLALANAFESEGGAGIKNALTLLYEAKNNCDLDCLEMKVDRQIERLERKIKKLKRKRRKGDR